jgi:hypothetical protein
MIILHCPYDHISYGKSLHEKYCPTPWHSCTKHISPRLFFHSQSPHKPRYFFILPPSNFAKEYWASLKVPHKTENYLSNYNRSPSMFLILLVPVYINIVMSFLSKLDEC